ncbi:hypothetical protein PBI_YUNGJAMAL_81 [Mycobacterium phage YungJamal]|uniref:Uncharacterized protein n=1 Tax=Mycobacterium phage YungJamal TaxID=1505226 RepID=A0A076GE82_BPMCO|nr:hypothetical protein PBI_YUNGJAMAL_81 [Mycobacterium phage YungJamal]
MSPSRLATCWATTRSPTSSPAGCSASSIIKSAPVLVIARRYRDQTEKWPSGEFFATAIPFPHRHDCGECKRFIWPL